MAQTRYLILEDGKVFSGKGFGATGECVGEAVFQTSMCGLSGNSDRIPTIMVRL